MRCKLDHYQNRLGHVPVWCSGLFIHRMNRILASPRIGGVGAEKEMIYAEALWALERKSAIKNPSFYYHHYRCDHCCSLVDLPKWPWGRIWWCWGTLTTQLSAGKAIQQATDHQTSSWKGMEEISQYKKIGRYTVWLSFPGSLQNNEELVADLKVERPWLRQAQSDRKILKRVGIQINKFHSTNIQQAPTLRKAPCQALQGETV